MIFQRIALAAAVAALFASCASAKDGLLAQAVASPLRSPAAVARDGARHPLQSLTFWGLKPGDVIVEIDPGEGYWTEILAPYAKQTGGRYIAAEPDLNDPATPDAAKAGRKAFEARYADPAAWGRVTTVDFGPNSGPLAPDGTVDFVLTARNIHNFLWVPGRLEKVFADVYAALKPGGVLAVEEHRADPRAMVPQARDGYVSEAVVIAAAHKAGFRYAGRSDINANPKDTKDYPFGVWTLPPTRRSAAKGPPDPAFDHSRYDAIGESDRMTLRFRKPG